jgi:aminoglycoside phosphotransferase
MSPMTLPLLCIPDSEYAGQVGQKSLRASAHEDVDVSVRLPPTSLCDCLPEALRLLSKTSSQTCPLENH